MKKLIYTFGVVALFAGLAACSGKKQQEEIKADDAKIAELESSYQQASSFNDSLIMLMGDIYTGLDSINSQEQLLYAPGQGDNANRRQEIKQNLGAIKARLAANREILDQLEKKLKSSHKNNAVKSRQILFYLDFFISLFFQENRYILSLIKTGLKQKISTFFYMFYTFFHNQTVKV